MADIEKRQMGKTGALPSMLGFGCMRFPTNPDGTIDEVKAEQMLDRAIAGGVNYIDTAYPYHNRQSEPFLGRVLQKYDRSSYYLATKLPLWKIKTLEDVDETFEEQISRLCTDYFDFYLMHAVNKERWDVMVKLGVVERLEELKKEGRIRNLGFSFHDTYEAFEEILCYREWDFCQIQLNFMDTDVQAGMKGYELTVRKQVPLIIMEPIKGGSLAAFSRDIEEKFHAHDKDASIASFALRWVGSLPNVKVILSGMSTMEQVEDNLKTFSPFRPLSEAEMKTVEEVVSILRGRVQNGCTGCGYCMPCPFGVDIPGTFSIWNTYHMYQNYNMVKWRWEGRDEKKLPVSCVRCGKCENVCPQKIKIREDLARAQKDLDEVGGL